MKKRLLFLGLSLLFVLRAYATDYYTKSPSATLTGNTNPSANWTTNSDGTSGLTNVVIQQTDNLFILSGATVTMSAATAVNNLDIQGGTTTTLALGDNSISLTVGGNLTGTCKRIGTKGYFLMSGMAKELAYTDAVGSNALATVGDPTVNKNSGIRITGTVKLTGPTTVLASVDVNGSGQLSLNGQTLNAGVVNSGTLNKLIGGPNSELSILTQGASNTSYIYLDGAAPGTTNFLERFSYASASPSNVSAFTNLRSSLVVNNLSAGKNSTTGNLKFDGANITLSVKGTYSCTASIGANTLAPGNKFVFEPGSILSFVNETSKPIQNGSNVTINGGTLKLESFATTPTVGQSYTLLNGSTSGTVAGTFTNLLLPSGYPGTVDYGDNKVRVTVSGLPPTYRMENFDSTAIRNIWSTTSGNTISLSAEHLKNGSKSLKWNAVSGGKLAASFLKIPLGETSNWTNNGTRFYVYNQTATNDTVIIRFYDNAGVVKRVGRMLLNYTGWREYHRSLRFDFGYTGNSNQNGLPGFTYDKFELEYKPQSSTSATTLYLDAISFIGIEARRTPGPHMLPDLNNLSVAYNVNTEPLRSWLRQPDIPVTTVTATDTLADWEIVKNRFARSIDMPSTSDVTDAKAFVTNLGIIRNSDNTLIGANPQLLSFSEADLGTYGKWVGVLARAFIKGGDQEARDKCKLLVEYLLDQGVAEGGATIIASSSYTNVDLFFKGFLDATPILATSLKAEVVKLLKWSLSYGQFYGKDFTPGYDVDYVHSKSFYAFETGFAIDDPNERIRELKTMKRFMERFTEFSEGTRDGFKVDGTGFHHNNIYPGYMYNINLWLKQVDLLKGTLYRINKSAYDRMSFVIKALTMAASPGMSIYANSLSARHPFSRDLADDLYVKNSAIKSLIGVGADIIGQAVEPDLASAYNYFFSAENAYPSVPAADFNQFHQYNYGQLGILRNKSWVATLRGFTNKLWGTETYVEDNRYGRYQSYGALEFTYGSTLKDSGYLKDGQGWDWNVAPGTTTVYTSWTALKTIGSYVDEFQKKSFAGALAAGKNGVWAMDFEQKPDANSYTVGDLKFKKSVFAFDNVFVALGTGITTTNSSNITQTNLFQNVYSLSETQPAFYLNSTSGQTANITQGVSTSSGSAWLVNTVGTGYYVPQGNGTIEVVRGQQQSPDERGINQNHMANATKAWINHGLAPTNKHYQFVAVPNVTPTQMQTLAGQFANRNVYIVEKQSDTLHAVKYVPQNLTGYAFFQQADNVNIGLVKSLSGQGLVMVKDAGNAASVSFTNPDLNAVDTTDYKFRTRPYTATLMLAGKWNKVSSVGGSADPTVTVQGENTAITFTVRDGLKVDIQLEKIISAKLKVIMQDGDNGQTINNHIKPNLKLMNEGTNAVPYSELTMRYWLTAENYAEINTWIDYAELGNSKVKMTYVPLTQPRANAFGYIEYSFEASAGTLVAGGNSGQIQSRFANTDWSNLTETDDYSYRALTNYTANDRVTAYRNGELVWGIEPASVTPQVKLSVYSENKNSSTNGNTISTYLKLTNEGNMPVAYEDLSVRYWFTADGTQNLNYWVDYAKLDNANILGQFVGNVGRAMADTYFQISVKPTAGALYPASSTGNIQYRIAKTDWSNFNETNDHSYKAAAPFDTNSRITVYYKGQLIYGTEPAVTSGSRLAASAEPGTTLQATVLGNPVQGDEAEVIIQGVSGHPLRMILVSPKGEHLSDKQVAQAESTERHSFLLGRGAGVYLLRVSTLTEAIVLKIVKP